MREQSNVLVVDDNPDLLSTFALILKRKGYNVETANDGPSAISKFSCRRYDVILMDIIMPGMSGIDAFRRLREIDPEVKVILMTAYYEQEQIISALDRGAYSAIHKPINIARLIELIAGATAHPQILIVDDDDELRWTMARILERKGFRVATAASAEEAVRIAREKDCRLAFIDVKMPSANGLQAYLKLKEVNSHMTAVLMTGFREEVGDIVSKALASKAAGCLYKPLDFDEVLLLAAQIDCSDGEEDAKKREHITSR